MAAAGIRMRLGRVLRDWTDADDQHIRDTYGREPTTDIAVRLGRSPSGVRDRAQRLGLKHGRQVPTVDQKSTRLVRTASNGVSLVWLDTVYGAPKGEGVDI